MAKKPIELYDYQVKAISQMKNGCILCGGVGSGKSRTALAYYYIHEGGLIGKEQYLPMLDPPRDLYIITTARKRDTCEWEKELVPFLLSTNYESNLYSNTVIVDSWNNVKKYANVTKAFFIFDEQRVVGNGSWVKAFLEIAKKNKWILLSATPGDTWMDYVPVFIANGFFRNRTEFNREHVVFSSYAKFPKVERYINTGRLLKMRRDILVDMDFVRETESHHEDVIVNYDRVAYHDLMKARWNTDKQRPIAGASELCYELRRLVNTHPSRLLAVQDIVSQNNKVIIFYNFDYELELLRNLQYGKDYLVAEWNGHKHEQIPKSKKWVYLVQYTAGAEGWNCVETDTIIFYSQNYSYKIMAQSAGRIDRLNTPYKDLYFYHLKSRSSIDLGISRALSKKQKFNERKFAIE